MAKWIVGFMVLVLLALAAVAVITALNAQGHDQITCGPDNAPPAYVTPSAVYCWDKDLVTKSTGSV